MTRSISDLGSDVRHQIAVLVLLVGADSRVSGRWAPIESGGPLRRGPDSRRGPDNGRAQFSGRGASSSPRTELVSILRVSEGRSMQMFTKPVPAVTAAGPVISPLR